ncbi:MAG TPA: DNA-directed RNA polymerase subunit delta [Syntrophomonadaceae bacterium]|nr:DNA-directed RNA polymerase subunit delta [Syntrophomonadaceae bacterium]
MLQGKKSEIDWAVEILVERQQAMHYLELIEEISDRMGRKKDPVTLSSMYTRLNLDNRLVYQGDGYWYYDTNRPLKVAPK